MIGENFLSEFELWLSSYAKENSQKKNFVEVLEKSKWYSLSSGGKRFRPFLAAEIFQIWQGASRLNQIRNFCIAIEMIHTYSLIHDDLPCMDNDDFRRGKPTNHKVFQEDIALLAGDALLTDAFHLLSSDKENSATAKIRVIEYLSEKIGSFGMVGGQVLDMKAGTKETVFSELEKIHEMKTAHLIMAAAVGGACFAGASEVEVGIVEKFAQHLGMAFQIKDDLLDSEDKAQAEDKKNYVAVIGLNATREQLGRHSDAALRLLDELFEAQPPPGHPSNKRLRVDQKQRLQKLVSHNLQRDQ